MLDLAYGASWGLVEWNFVLSSQRPILLRLWRPSWVAPSDVIAGFCALQGSQDLTSGRCCRLSKQQLKASHVPALPWGSPQWQVYEIEIQIYSLLRDCLDMSVCSLEKHIQILLKVVCPIKNSTAKISSVYKKYISNHISSRLVLINLNGPL